jgi:integrase/recombinase XerD
MGTLREQMEGDLVVRGMSERTRESYVGAVAKLAKHYGRSPDRITEEEVQSYLLHLIASASSPGRAATSRRKAFGSSTV